MSPEEFREMIHERERKQWEAGVRVGMFVGFVTALLVMTILGVVRAD